MTRYFILSKDASIFWDPSSKLKVVSSDEANPDAHDGQMTERIKIALKHNHIIEVKLSGKKTVKALSKSQEDEVDKNDDEDEGNDVELTDRKLTEMTQEELIKYYTDTFEVSTEDLAKFKKLKQKAMVKFLEEEAEEEES